MNLIQFKEKKASIDKLPYDVAVAVADEIWSWKIKGKQDESEKEMDAQGRREGAPSLSSLTRVSQKCNSLWMEFMLRHVRLQSEHLPRFIELLERDPSLGALVHHIHFWDQEEFVSPSIVDRDRATFEPGYQLHYPNWKRDQLDSVDEDILASKRAFILDSLPNLRSIHASGQELVFPFCKRVGKDAVMLRGLLSPSLKSINIGGPDIKKPSISSAKVVWLLINLQQLDQATFCATLDMADAKFLKDHYEVLAPTKLGIKNFEISLLPWFTPNSNGGYPVVSAKESRHYSSFVLNLLKFTKQLQSFTFRFEMNEYLFFFQNGVLSQGLQDSISSLKKITIMGTSAENFLSINPYKMFWNLEELVGDDQFFLLHTRHLPSLAKVKDAATLGMAPKVRHVSLAFNVATPKGGTHNFTAMESTFSHFVEDVPQEIQLETVSTFRDPIDEYGIHHEFFLENYKWTKARKELFEACEKRNVKLVLLEK